MLGACYRAPRWRAGLALLLALCAGAGAQARRLDAAARWAAVTPRELVVEATVAAVGRFDVELGDVVAVEGSAPPAPERIRLREAPELARGERLRARLRLRPPRGLRNPGARDRERSLRRAGVGAVAVLVHPALRVRIPERDALDLLAPMRRLRVERAERLREAGAGGALLAALALGERAGLAQQARDAFARLGIAHLLAVSGLHLGLAAALVYLAVRRVAGRWPWLAARWDTRLLAVVACLPAAGAYALLAGWGLPVRRAWVLLLALAFVFARRRPTARGQPLALAAVAILAREPQALFDAGAQLSFAATAALMLAAGGPGGMGVLRASATAAAVTAPLAALLLGSRAPAALLVNLIAVPWTGFVLLPAALAAALVDLAPLVWLAERIAAASLAAALWLDGWLPGTSAGPPPAWPWLLASTLSGLLALLARSTRNRVAWVMAGGTLLWLAPPARLVPQPPRAVFLDVGQGDASLVQGARGALLVDAGLALPDGPDLGRRAVVPALRALGVERLDLVVVSHADLDHRGGVPAVLESFPVGALWLPPGGRADEAFAPVSAAAAVRGVEVLERARGDEPLRAGDLVVTPLWPPRDFRGSRNDRSLVVRVEVAGRRVLLPGDLEAAGEAALLARGADLRADVLKLAHHGSRSSSTRAFLAAVDAELAVASAPCAGRFGMPHDEVRRRAREAGLPLWWTGRDGALRVGLGPALHAFASGEPRRCVDSPPSAHGATRSGLGVASSWIGSTSSR